VCLVVESNDSKERLVELARRAQGIEHAGPARAYVGGTAANYASFVNESKEDFSQSERLSAPIAALLLLLVFGGLVAGLLPVLAGLASVTVAIGILGLVARAHTISIFSLNLSTVLGLGLGMDYSLLPQRQLPPDELAGQLPLPLGRRRRLPAPARLVPTGAWVPATASVFALFVVGAYVASGNPRVLSHTLQAAAPLLDCTVPGGAPSDQPPSCSRQGPVRMVRRPQGGASPPAGGQAGSGGPGQASTGSRHAPAGHRQASAGSGRPSVGNGRASAGSGQAIAGNGLASAGGQAWPGNGQASADGQASAGNGQASAGAGVSAGSGQASAGNGQPAGSANSQASRGNGNSQASAPAASSGARPTTGSAPATPAKATTTTATTPPATTTPPTTASTAGLTPRQRVAAALQGREQRVEELEAQEQNVAARAHHAVQERQPAPPSGGQAQATAPAASSNQRPAPAAHQAQPAPQPSNPQPASSPTAQQAPQRKPLRCYIFWWLPCRF
jgi:MMPL family